MFSFAPLRDTNIPDWLEPYVDGILPIDEIGFTDFDVVSDGTDFESSGKIAWLKEIEFDLPALDSVSIALLAGDGMTEVAFTYRRSPDFEIRLVALNAALRLKTKLLHRVHQDAKGTWVPSLDSRGEPKRVEFVFSAGDVILSADGDVSFVADPALSMLAVELGESGIVLEILRVQLYLSEKQTLPPNVPPGFKGVAIEEAALHFTRGIAAGAPNEVILSDVLIGSSGFSGKVKANWTGTSHAPQEAASLDAGQGTLFGCPFTPHFLTLEFRQNVPVASSFQAEILLPFFDHPANVDISLGIGGGLSVALSPVQPPGMISENGLVTLTKEGVLSMTLDSIAIQIDDGVFTLKLSGKLTPLFGKDKGLKWPTFDVKELSIDSKGHVHLDGGWLSLPKQQTLNFYGFKIEITKLGFGNTDDGGKWIGFSGGVHLVDALPQGASVDGLRITWYEDGRKPKITMDGVGVEFLIPEVLYFKGAVSYHELTDGAGNAVHRFDGDIRLVLATPEMDIDGTIVFGSVKGEQGPYNFFAIYLDGQLPTGIPIASTGLAITGFAGLFALQMEPKKKPDEQWFSIDHGKSFYHRPETGMIDLKSKWEPRKGSFALGAGVTIGSYSDNSFAFYGKFLLGIICPGPIIFLQGAASFLKKHEGDGKDEGQFRALAIYDGRAGSLLFGLDAEYKTGSGGEMIEIAGSMEAFYAFHNPRAWHLWLGKKDPREQRIRALFGRFVEANAYFMLDAHQLALGAWFGYSNGWNFGPLSIRLEAWAEGNVLISFRPTQFHGDLWIHCLVELSAFGIGLGIELDARIAADLFKPFHLKGEFSVGIKLPWPFKKKIGATVVLEWGPRLDPPPLPLPLTQVAVEHFKSRVVWPLPRGRFLLPKWADDDGFLLPNATGATQPNYAEVPVVPLDSRISLTFGRSVDDRAKVGVVIQPVPVEKIGDPGGGTVATVGYALTGLQLSRRNGQAWDLVAQSPKTGTTPALFGSWATVPALPDQSNASALGQTKLFVWSKSAYDFTRGSGSSWDEWISDGLPDYPCLPPLPATEICFGFESLQAGTQVKSPWTHPGPPAVTLSWGFGPATVVVRQQGQWQTNFLCFPDEAVRHGIRVRPSVPVRSFRIGFEPARPAGGPEATFSSGSSATCVDVRPLIAGTVANPWTMEDVRFTVRDAAGELLPLARRERWGTSPIGLNAGYRLDIELPCASPWVELIVTHRPPFRIVAFNAAGAAVATHAPLGNGAETTETIRLEGAEITRVEVHAAGSEKLVHSVCYFCTRPPGPSGTGHDDHGHPYGPFFPGVDDTLVVTGGGMTSVDVSGDVGFCIRMICVTPDPEAGQGVRREEAIQHIREQLVHWQNNGAVLEPNSTYRLTIETAVAPSSTVVQFPSGDYTPTEHAYFRTEGPPGLTKLLPPEGVVVKDFDSGLDDLVRYVRETDPPTVPPAGEKPILFRPFYRAYDINVEFNENYVDQMYRMDRRDLGLYLYTSSNEPVRDARGRLILLADTWGTEKTITLTDKDIRWITLIDNATCLAEKLDPETIPRASALGSSSPNRVLAPDTLHEARLVPRLLHETFSSAPLDPGPPPGWYVEDMGSGGPSVWQVGEVGEPPRRFIEQQSAIGSSAAERPGTQLLLAVAPEPWTDYRVSVYVRSAAGGAIGVVVRQQGPGTGYRFSLDGRMRRLVKFESGAATTLREDHFGYRKNRDYLLTVEVLGKTIRAYVDGEPVFELDDSTYDKGTCGLYTCQSAGARFTDVVVDDLSKGAPVVYRFSLTTSLYANFFHHLHSFEDVIWNASLAPDAAVDAALQQAVTASFTPPDEKESRAYEELASKLLGAAALQNAARVEITRVDRGAASPIFLLRSPEPVDPKRTVLALSQSARASAPVVVPSAVKLTDAVLGAARPEDEAVTVLLRDAVELTRHRIELHQLPGPLAQPMGDPLLLLEAFNDDGALARFTIADDAAAGGASLWKVESGALVELSGIGGGNEPELPGSLAVIGDPEWNDCRLTAELRADAGGEVGVLLRFADDRNYYRLSLGATLSYRRLMKCVGGEMSIVWQDETRGYTAGEPFRIVLEAVGTRLSGFFGEERIFDVLDSSLATGRAGIYAAANEGARCERIEVRRPSLEARSIFSDRFAQGDLTAWSFASDPTPLEQSARWEASGDALHIATMFADSSGPAYPGTYAFAGDAAWTGVVLQASLRSAGGTIGLAVRAADLDHYYRFSMNREEGYRQLVKKAGAATTELWRDSVRYDANRVYELTIVALGSSLRGYLDGVPLFAIDDDELSAGRIALYARNNRDAWFSDVRIWPGELAFDRFLLQESSTPAPDRWTLIDNPGAAHYAIASQPEVTELRVTLRASLDPGGSMAIIFGWGDVAHHLALWLDAKEGRRQLLRMGGGIPDVLWQDGVRPDSGRDLTLTLDLCDGRTSGFVDGVEIFALDFAAPAGRVGFATQDAQFRELLLSVPEWSCWHAFGEEERLPAGTRLRVHGAAPVAPPQEAGLVLRSASLPGERGRLRLRAGGAVLRVVTADGRAGHTRGFLPASAFSPLDMHVLRKADGTAFFFVPDAMQAGPAESLRLDLIFHRDRKDAGRAMSQSGDLQPERVTIGIGEAKIAAGAAGTPRRPGTTSLIQSALGVNGNFEVIAPAEGGGLAHYWRDNSDPALPWHGPTIFGASAGEVDAVALIQSSFGNLEVVARIGDRLAHFWRDSALNWSAAEFFATGASGTPSFIQSRFGTPGNFEVVTPLAAGGMAHLWRNNQTLEWSAPAAFAVDSGIVDDVSLIHGSFDNLEVVARIGDRLAHFWRDSALNWSGADFFTAGCTGSPSLIQVRAGTPPNFEVVVPLATGGIGHLSRNNQTLGWSSPVVLGSGAIDSVSLIQSRFDDSLQVLARRGGTLIHYWRDAPAPFTWHGPATVAS